MPTYDYECKVCHTHFEASHEMQAPGPACPRCGGAADQVFLSAPAVHGRMARGREAAMRSLQSSGHGPDCRCCH